MGGMGPIFVTHFLIRVSQCITFLGVGRMRTGKKIYKPKQGGCHEKRDSDRTCFQAVFAAAWFLRALQGVIFADLKVDSGKDRAMASELHRGTIVARLDGSNMTRINGLEYSDPVWDPCSVDRAPGHSLGAQWERFLTACIADARAHPTASPANVTARALAAVAEARGVPLAALRALASEADWIERATAYLEHEALEHARYERHAATLDRQAASSAMATEEARIAFNQLRKIEVVKHLREAARPGAPPGSARDLEILGRVVAMGPVGAAPPAAPVAHEPDFAAMSLAELDRYAALTAELAAFPRRSGP